MYTAKDFMNLKKGIIKNAILNNVLSGYMMHEERFRVAVSLRSTQEARKLLVSCNSAAALSEPTSEANHYPNYGMANIIVDVSNGVAKVGYFFPKIDLPIVWEKKLFTIQNGIDAKKITEYIYSKYPIHPGKMDTIFSEAPISLGQLLEAKKISSNVWKTGLSKNLKSNTNTSIDYSALDVYYTCLRRKYIEWRICNIILLSLYKHNMFNATNPSFGRLTVHFSKGIMVSMGLYNRVENINSSRLLPVGSINPSFFSTYDETVNSNLISIIDLIKFYTST